jgi:hypothetical protein
MQQTELKQRRDVIKRGKGQYVRARTVRKLVVEMETKLRDEDQRHAQTHTKTHAQTHEKTREKEV